MAAKLADDIESLARSFIRGPHGITTRCFVRPTTNELADNKKIVIGSFIYSRPARHHYAMLRATNR